MGLGFGMAKRGQETGKIGQERETILEVEKIKEKQKPEVFLDHFLELRSRIGILLENGHLIGAIRKGRRNILQMIQRRR